MGVVLVSAGGKCLQIMGRSWQDLWTSRVRLSGMCEVNFEGMKIKEWELWDAFSGVN